MNSVILIGRLTKDPDVKYTSGENPVAVATFNLAVNRMTKGEEKIADFPRIKVLGRQAENCERYLKKGRLVGIEGTIQTGSYKNKSGEMVYTTEILANRVEFLEWGNRSEAEVPQGFAEIEDDIPF